MLMMQSTAKKPFDLSADKLATPSNKRSDKKLK
jgi:hypothetical protein